MNKLQVKKTTCLAIYYLRINPLQNVVFISAIWKNIE